MPNNQDKFLAFTYKASILLAFLGLMLSAGYLFVYLCKSPAPGEIKNPATMVSFNADRRMALISTAIFVGMSFGFLGFALFLLNAKGEVEGEASIGDYKFKIAKLSPGLFVILCATVIIITCSNFRISYSADLANYVDGTDTTTKHKKNSTEDHPANVTDTTDDVPASAILGNNRKH